MTVIEILEQAKVLSPQERQELARLLLDMDASEAIIQAKTGADIVMMLETMEPIEFVDAHIEDPVAWVKAQRRMWR